MLAWLVDEQGIEPHIPVFDKSRAHRRDLLARDFTYDQDGDAYVCPGRQAAPQTPAAVQRRRGPA